MSASSTNNNYDGWISRTFSSDSTQQATSNTHLEDNKERMSDKIRPTRLVLHLDINETILLGDDAGGDSTSDSIQKMLAKSAFCQVPSNTDLDWDNTQQLEPTHWWDDQKIGQETSMPPLYTGWEWPPNTCPYYRTKFQKYSKEFVSESTEEEAVTKEPGHQPHHGKIYKPIWEECQRLLSSVDTSPAAQASMRRHPHLLPAFYHILDYLQGLQQSTAATTTSTAASNPPPVTLVFRTFGTDIQEVVQWVTEYAKEQDYPWLQIGPSQLFQGRWKELEEKDDSNGGANNNGNKPSRAIYQLWDLAETHVVAKDEDEILKLLNSGTIFGIRDDYNYWKKYQWLPTAGKPVWIPTTTSSTSTPANSSSSNDEEEEPEVFCHHLLFDDNIHNLPDDGIACIRQQQQEQPATDSTKFTTVDASIMHGGEYQGIHLKRVPTVEPVLNPKWYIEQIEHSRVLLQEKLMKQVAKD
mmetsp:Transcript_20025/g.49196  ORF Transcript_20025/g.49196 Transcript_20025/m.49196 type:complete len:468 (+) Transcript_20025:371-1774(+)|eukprot:CAMPEP_0113621676 /NCGR_PEP_ID=MMETSP0017_2-20120614/11087_1 /TAXON_ID=2856 /ORGANISM="Cylindrotheca closterium" /LENGTH=467 /DNA_ID=CAMNT_0000531447 /DNA_START=371 /DNA_END=1774 /DNA_ORIENTATION=+ /assembly_acc=CAM_ASM_000147